MPSHEPKIIFITGGVVSSLGKGITAASVGSLLQARGLNVSVLKLDPYLNVDPGTMNPFQHGEVFVTSDGAETDLDLGHYERFLGIELKKDNSKSAGQIYTNVLQKERNGDYLGATVQIIPHVTDEIKAAIKTASLGTDILICEVGGTVGDIESLPFIEAIRQYRADCGHENTLFLHLSYVPFIPSAKEFKTKPTQHSVKTILSQGIQPDILLIRSEQKIPEDIKKKTALFCNVPPQRVINCYDQKSIYQVPLMLHEEGLDELITNHLNIWSRKPNLKPWKDYNEKFQNPQTSINIAIVGKYTELTESYKSIHEALGHAGVQHEAKIVFHYFDAAKLTSQNIHDTLKDCQGLLIPGGFGERGVEGKIAAVKWARENNLPFLGICLGLQIAVIEFAKNVAGISNASSEEFDNGSSTNVIHMMETQAHISKKGGTMRLGNYPCDISPNTLSAKIFSAKQIEERHRHRYEVNNQFLPQLKKAGLVVAGTCPKVDLVEIIEVPNHPFFVAVQFHPEFNSRPHEPHPLFSHFINAAISKGKK